MQNLTIDPAHLTQLKKYLKQAVSNPRETIDLLSWARTVIKNYEEFLIKSDAQVSLFQGTNKHCQCLALSEVKKTNTSSYCITDSEPDIVHFSIQFKALWHPRKLSIIKTEEIFTYIMIFMLSDCTDCCNALKYINLTHAGIYCYGEVGMTYHS